MTKKILAPKPKTRRAPTPTAADPLFETLDAFENLRGQLIRIHVMATAADEALEGIAFVPPAKRAASDRLFAFVELTHELTTAAVASADAAQARLAGVLKKGGRHV